MGLLFDSRKISAPVSSLPVLFIALLLLPALKATTIGFVATDLADVTPGEDLWRFDYSVSGRTFLLGEFFDIYFDPALYRSLMAGPTPNSSWDAIILQQPEPLNFPPFDAGIFDAFALVNEPSLEGVFSVSFMFLGSGSPAAQAFDVFGSSGNVLESGLTSPVQAVPEPATAVPFLLSLALLGVKFALASRTGVQN